MHAHAHAYISTLNASITRVFAAVTNIADYRTIRQWVNFEVSLM